MGILAVVAWNERDPAILALERERDAAVAAKEQAEREAGELREKFSEALTECLLEFGDNEGIDMPTFHKLVMERIVALRAREG